MSEPTKAKRGDLVVVTRTHYDYIIGQGGKERTTASLGIVASVTRDGIVKKYRTPFSTTDPCSQTCRVDAGHDNVRILARELVNPDVLMAAYREHTYPGSTGHIMPFDSLDEAREFVHPFLKEQTT